MCDTPMVIDPVANNEFWTLQHALGHNVQTTLVVYDLMWHHGLDAIHGTAVHAGIQAGLSEAKALGMYQNYAPDPISTPASLLKRPHSLSPPLTHPTSPPPQISSRYRKAP